MVFDTSVLDAALARRREKNEQERQAMLRHVLHLLDEQGQSMAFNTFPAIINRGK